MTTKLCLNCGSESSVETRFCRWCGQPLDVQEPTSVTEATTQILNPTHERHATGWRVNVTPTAAIAPTSVQTTKLETAKCAQQLGTRLIAGFLLATAIVFSITLTYKLLGASASSSRIAASTPPLMPPIPLPPPKLLGRTAPPQASSNNPLAYPNSEVMVDIASSNENRILQLRTTDSVDKVAEWYTGLLHPSKKIKLANQSVILNAAEAKVVIRATNSKTHIIVKQESDKNN